MRTPVSLRRAAAAAASAVAVLVIGALPAAAHVTVSSPDAEPGGFGKLIFRVPNESGSADTTKVSVQLPSDTPLAFVSTKPMPGWSVEAEPTKLDEPVDVNGATVTEAVTDVTWTAEDGNGLAPGEFGEFEISVGPIPDAQALSFPTTQTYSDGEVVRWSQPMEPGASEAEEPEHPAPLLEMTETSVEEASTTTPVASSDADNLARVLGGVAVVLGAGALLVALRPRPRKS